MQDASSHPPDWLPDLSLFQGSGDRLSLTDLLPGDLLKVATLRSTYFFRVVQPRQRLAEMWKVGSARPSERVQLMGGTLGLSSSIDPRHLFCGGGLEYTREGGARTHTTTAIRSLTLLRRGAVPPA